MQNRINVKLELDRTIEIANGLDETAIVSITNNSGDIIHVNEKFIAISGYSREELIGSNHRILNSGHHPKEFFQKMWETITQGSLWQGEICNRKKDGNLYWVNTSIVHSVDIQGKAQFISIRFDITKQKNFEKELMERKQLFAFVLQNLPVAVFAKDITKDFQMILWNKKAEEIFGVAAPDIVGKYDHDLFPAEQAAVFRARDKEACLSREVRINEELAQTPTGQITLHTRKIVIRDSSDKPCILLGITEDISDLRRREMQDIQNSKLIEMGTMSAGIAHEINNPLAIISGSLHMLSRNLEDPERILKIIETLKKSTDRIGKIVLGLKKYSRNSIQGNYRNVHLSDIVKESLILTGIKARNESVPVTFSLETDAQIFCDEVEIEQVLINLINNSIDAIKNCDKKWVRVEMVDEQNYCVLKVIDSGNGIPDKIKATIFEPFFTTKNVGEGTGLGLSITKAILTKHGAEISLVNEGENTCFAIRFNRVANASVA